MLWNHLTSFNLYSSRRLASKRLSPLIYLCSPLFWINHLSRAPIKRIEKYKEPHQKKKKSSLASEWEAMILGALFREGNAFQAVDATFISVNLPTLKIGRFRRKCFWSLSSHSLRAPLPSHMKWLMCNIGLAGINFLSQNLPPLGKHTAAWTCW